MPHQREVEKQQPEVSVPPSWEPWTPEERNVAQPEGQDETTPLVLAEQKQHLVELPQQR
jgi:hypothetical protein